MKLSVILVLFNFFFCYPNNTCLSNPVKEIVLKETIKSIPKKASRQKIRWKKVFAKIIIFKKRWIFWLLIFGGVVLSMTLIFYFLDKRGGVEMSDALAYSLLGIYLLSLLAVVLLIVSLPVIWIVRFFRELGWRKRFSRCP